MKQLLIAGIDPGTTVGYAALDTNGKLIKAKAAKELDLDKVVAELSSLGTVIVIATDKAKIPSFVSAVATKLGARTFSPREDLLVAEKRIQAQTYEHSSSHEMDALAAAILAFKKYERMFIRIRNFLADKKHPELFSRLTEIVIRQEISVTAGFDFLTMPEKKEVKDLKEALSQKQLSHTDYWKLYDSFITAESEKKLLQQQNNKLIKLAKRLKNKTNNLRNAVKPETRIIRPTAELEEARRTIKILQQSLQQTLSRQQRLQHILLHQEEYAIAKKMRNLGFDEFKRVSRILGFKPGDILFVEDPNTVSERTLSELKENIELIIAVRQTKPKVAEQIPFTILDASSISHTQDEYFAFLDKKSFEKARSDKALLRKLIEDYQAERKGI